MSQTRNQQALQRGILAARMWKRLKSTILRLDQRCVSKARAHKFPGWVGHIPMSMFAIIMLAALVFGGMIIASSAVLVGALVLLVSGSFSSEGDANRKEGGEDFPPTYLNNDFGTKYRSGPHGWGWYDSTGYMHDEDEN
ncbi:hypothetical protein HC231_18285 [Brenneria izadpanahii]|uniref:DUF3742 domain-containing protein n=1 Tax=Brenneria izadpanahii TaxID=2722756 RepID=A0ABX7UZR4_9GAMM|nr:hypothetical protein [Brenneria izadpanahii]QTF09650.1 hypothetical protein HC231_18285 [Brenneria izadpanahii]